MNELVGEDLPGCESSYETSIIMLEALLEQTTSSEEQDSSNALDEEDRLTIEKCTLTPTRHANMVVIQSIRKRLDALRKKLDFASQRNSPTPSEKDRDRLRRLSSGSNNSIPVRDSPTISTTTPTPTTSS